ncbi:protein prune 2 like [Crotalus adamanteus]|uniref:Protein prune 2 like n=1 Tax=Crotalus adamanteus TaxID=8729 RepID=A0AAW1C1J3_CROAD
MDILNNAMLDSTAIEMRPEPPNSLDLNGSHPRRIKLTAPNINLSLDQSEGSVLSDENLDTPDEIDINVDDLDTPDEADSLEYAGHEEQPAIKEPSQEESESIPEYTAEEEREDNRLWRTVVIGDQEQRIDMKAIEPFKKVISHGGYYGDGLNAIIVFAACFLPDSSQTDYTYVMENLFLLLSPRPALSLSGTFFILPFGAKVPREWRRRPTGRRSCCGKSSEVAANGHSGSPISACCGRLELRLLARSGRGRGSSSSAPCEVGAGSLSFKLCQVTPGAKRAPSPRNVNFAKLGGSGKIKIKRGREVEETQQMPLSESEQEKQEESFWGLCTDIADSSSSPALAASPVETCLNLSMSFSPTQSHPAARSLKRFQSAPSLPGVPMEVNEGPQRLESKGRRRGERGGSSLVNQRMWRRCGFLGYPKVLQKTQPRPNSLPCPSRDPTTVPPANQPAGYSGGEAQHWAVGGGAGLLGPPAPRRRTPLANMCRSFQAALLPSGSGALHRPASSSTPALSQAPQEAAGPQQKQHPKGKEGRSKLCPQGIRRSLPTSLSQAGIASLSRSTRLARDPLREQLALPPLPSPSGFQGK